MTVYHLPWTCEIDPSPSGVSGYLHVTGSSLTVHLSETKGNAVSGRAQVFILAKSSQNVPTLLFIDVLVFKNMAVPAKYRPIMF